MSKYTKLHEELAKLAGERKDKAIGAAAQARPWIKSGVKGAIPAAIAANLLLPFEGGAKRGLVAGAGILGAGLGMGDRALKQWAKKHKGRKVAKEILKQGGVEFEVPADQLGIRKVAAMAADLRMKGLGNVKRPPFPTEDSKRYASNMLKNSVKPGQFKTQTQPKHLVRPGPSIQQTATLPTG